MPDEKRTYHVEFPIVVNYEGKVLGSFNYETAAYSAIANGDTPESAEHRALFLREVVTSANVDVHSDAISYVMD